jgi:hypothetical protein
MITVVFLFTVRRVPDQHFRVAVKGRNYMPFIETLVKDSLDLEAWTRAAEDPVSVEQVLSAGVRHLVDVVCVGSGVKDVKGVVYYDLGVVNS